ncbi:MAG: hypothetical protein LQ352_008231 [Teloschistes flavicans]|nr:MAG: hypothetical protein LQ352_008231 [Teloschistes flavicans]
MKAYCNLNLSCFLLLFTAFFSHVAAQAGPTIANILNLSSELLAIQFVGAQTRPGALSGECAYFEGGQLQAEGYNTTAIKNIICQADHVFSTDNLPSIEQTRNLTIQYSSWIWIFQAIGDLQNDKNRLKKLCSLIDVPSAYAIGQNGTLVKNVICSVANGAPLPTVPLPVYEKE